MTDVCRFCRANRLLDDAPLFESPAFYVLGMRQPDRQHAVMIIPERHAATPFDIPPEDWAHFAEPLAFAKEHLTPLNPAGFTIGWNVGAAAGQTVGHVHLHVICRFDDDPAAGEGLNSLIESAKIARGVT